MMKSKMLIISAIILSVMNPLFGTDLEKEGFEILTKSDSKLYPYEGTFDFTVKQTDVEGQVLNYGLQGYKKGAKRQTVVFLQPEVNKNDVGMRSDEIIYYKPHKWPKPQIQSYTSLFMSTTFSWGDIMSSDIAYDYKAVEIQNTNIGNKDYFYLKLKPKKSNMYARIDIWINKSNNETLQRIYYTASGEKLKLAKYSDIVSGSGNVISFKVTIYDYLQEVTTVAEINNLKYATLPSYLFDPQNISRIRAK